MIGGLAKAYAFIGWGLPTVLLGLTWFLHGNDIGTDPECYIGWESQTKFPQYSYMFGCSGVGITLSLITLLNIEVMSFLLEVEVLPYEIKKACLRGSESITSPCDILSSCVL